MIRFIIVIVVLLLSVQAGWCRASKYDISYIWDHNLERVLDYEEQILGILSYAERKKVRIVGRKGGEFGLILDLDETPLASARLMVRQSELLRKAGLAECTVIEDRDYHRLYNVSYGLGPNLKALETLYDKIYHYLGSEVGKKLFIEKTDGENYTLIYRRRGDRHSTYRVARKHAKILKRKKIQTTIIPENNNPVIYGESSYLDGRAVSLVIAAKKQKRAAPPHLTEKKIVSGQNGSVAKSGFDGGNGSSRIENHIESYIKELRRKGTLSTDETTGWMVYDLTRNKKIVGINADQVFQAASMIKPFVALAFFHQVKRGTLIYGPKSRRKMERMIQRSDNNATNWVMRVVGGPARCQQILQDHYRHIFQNTRIVEYIPAGGRTYKNTALPSDYVRFLQALWDDELPYGKEMRRLMSLPGRDRLYDGTPIPQGTLVYNKTGSTAHLCGDMGILVPRDRNGRRYPYALVGIIERSSRPKNYGRWVLSRGNVIRQVSTIVYQEMKKRYHLR